MWKHLSTRRTPPGANADTRDSDLHNKTLLDSGAPHLAPFPTTCFPCLQLKKCSYPLFSLRWHINRLGISLEHVLFSLRASMHICVTQVGFFPADLFSFFFFLGEVKRQRSHWLAHSPNASIIQHWAQAKARSQALNPWLSRKWQWPSPLPSPRVGFSRKLQSGPTQEWNPGNQTWGV